MVLSVFVFVDEVETGVGGGVETTSFNGNFPVFPQRTLELAPLVSLAHESIAENRLITMRQALKLIETISWDSL